MANIAITGWDATNERRSTSAWSMDNGHLIASTDSSFDIGETSSPKRVRAIYVDTIGDSGQALSIGATAVNGAGALAISSATDTVLSIAALGTGTVKVKTQNTERWQFDANGHLVPITDNLYDIGDDTHRPKDVKVKNKVKVGDSIEITGTAVTGTDGVTGPGTSITVTPGGGGSGYNGGDLTLDAGPLGSGGTDGAIYIGGTNAESVAIGRSGKTTTIYGLTAADAAYFNVSILPDAIGGADLGSASAEWGDIYIASDKFLRFGNSQEASLGYDDTTDDKVQATGPWDFTTATLHAQPIRLATVASIDMTATGSTNLYTVPAGKTCVVQDVIVRVTAATAASGDAVAQVEITGSAADIVPSNTLTGMTTIDHAFRLSPVPGGKFRLGDAAEIIKLNVTSADTGTALTASADLIGYIF